MRANQLRLWFASMAYVLLCALALSRKGRLRRNLAIAARSVEGPFTIPFADLARHHQLQYDEIGVITKRIAQQK
jgi:hypothetical protein